MQVRVKIGELIEAVSRYNHVQLAPEQLLRVDDLGISMFTPIGQAPIIGMIKKQRPGLCIEFADGHVLRCADKHILYTQEKAVYASDLVVGDRVVTMNGVIGVEQVTPIQLQNFYDVSLPAPHVYFDSHGILHHNTLITAALSRICEPYGRTIVIVPSTSLVTQTEIDYRNVGLDVGVYYGKRKELSHRHTIATWQSIGVLNKKNHDGEADIPIDDFVKDVICVIGDECHTVRGKVLRDLLTGPFAKVPIRWGLTGTIPPEEHEWMCLLLAFGPKVGEIKSYDLQDLGILADSQIDIIQLVDDHVAFKDYNSEHDFLMNDTLRLQYIAKMIETWSSANTMVLVDRIETGKILQTLIPDSVFISGATKEQNRKAEYDSIGSVNGKVIIATYGVLSTGINLPRIFNVVFIEPGKSFVRVIQSLGRGLRKTQDKLAVRVFDVCSTLKFSARHLSKRKSFYNEYRHPFTTKKVTYL